MVDLSESMLRIIDKRIRGRSFIHPIRQVHEDILKFQELSQYDMVYANFFLNVFYKDHELQIIEHLTKLAKPKGYVAI